MNYNNNAFKDVDFTLVSKRHRNQRLNVRVTDVEKEWIDHIADIDGTNTSDVLRDALRTYKQKRDGGYNIL